MGGEEAATFGDLYGDILEDVLDSASREIETYCNRQFNKANETSVREYDPLFSGSIAVDDFHTTTGLVIRSGADYAATWSVTDYRLLPLNGIVSGQPGWPFSTIETRHRFGPPGIQVTAQWGWADVPAPVKQACLIMAAETFSIKNAPLGVAGLDQFGAIRVRESRMAAAKLRRYVLNPILVG
jgi:hypothetical protein